MLNIISVGGDVLDAPKPVCDDVNTEFSLTPHRFCAILKSTITKDGDDVNKEKLTLFSIKHDLMKVLSEQMYNKEEWRMHYIIPITVFAIAAGIFFKNVFVGLLIFLFAAYHIYKYVIELIEYNKAKKEILDSLDRGDVSIDVDVFSHVADETIYEPHHAGRRSRSTKTIKLFYFEGGLSWRVPTVVHHYSWSKEFYISTKGLDNMSVAGNEFYFVRLQKYPDVSYIYPCKIFELDESLKK